MSNGGLELAPCHIRSETVEITWQPDARDGSRSMALVARRPGAREWNRWTPTVHRWEDHWAPLAKLMRQAETADPDSEMSLEAQAVLRRAVPDDLLDRTIAILDAVLLEVDGAQIKAGWADAELAPEQCGALLLQVYARSSALTDFERGKSEPLSQ